MTTLNDLARLIRSKNAGPFFLTFDILFENERDYERACRSPALTPETVARLYGRDVSEVELFHYAPAHAIKITMPRKVPSCDVGDTDTHGGQQFVPLLDIPIAD